MAGAVTAQASEVTGSLSSDASYSSLTAGNISGSVSVGSDGNSSSGGRSGRSRDSLSNPPPGTVLGASDVKVLTPGFPNAGTPPEETLINDHTLWSRITSFFQAMFSR